MKSVKKITIQIIAGANVASILVMLLVGLTMYINPETHPTLSCLGLGFPFLLLINVLFLAFWVVLKPRMVVIPIVGFIICYFPIRTYFPLNISKDVPSSCIKLVSYNVMSYDFASLVQNEEIPILTYLSTCEADIICLQEASTIGWTKQVIDSTMNSRYPYHRVHSRHKDGLAMAIYSRFPIVSEREIEYESEANQSMAYEIIIQGRKTLVINNHFETNGLSEKDKSDFSQMVKGDMNNDSVRAESGKLLVKLASAAKKRAKQIRAVAQYIKRYKGKSIIVCGDFNENPISYSHHVFANELELTDCYVSTAFGPGWSYHKGGMYFRIDNIFCSNGWQPYNCRTDRSIGDSDHYPIVCWLKKTPF